MSDCYSKPDTIYEDQGWRNSNSRIQISYGTFLHLLGRITTKQRFKDWMWNDSCIFSK